MDITYRIIKSRRKTVAIEVTREGVLVRAPYRMSNRAIQKFVDEHERWIKKHLDKLTDSVNGAAPAQILSPEEIDDLMNRARAYIPERVRYYAPLVGVTYGRVTIRRQRTRWGSCSAKGNLNFNCLLMLTPPEVLDSVVVHELCHRKEMNHSAAFYREVLAVFPEYKKWDKWLKDNGPRIMRSLP